LYNKPLIFPSFLAITSVKEHFLVLNIDELIFHYFLNLYVFVLFLPKKAPFMHIGLWMCKQQLLNTRYMAQKINLC